MPRVDFLKDFDFSPSAKNGLVTIAYKAGQVEMVTSECWEKAKAGGHAKLAKRTPKGESDEQQ